jgi:hypothetical protein
MIRPGVVAGILERFVRVAADIQDRKLSRRRRALAQEPLVQVLLQAVVGELLRGEMAGRLFPASIRRAFSLVSLFSRVRRL